MDQDEKNQDKKDQDKKNQDDTNPFEQYLDSPDQGLKRLAEEFAATDRGRTPAERRARATGAGRTKPVAVRFDEFTLRRLRDLAARRNTGYQTLLKEFVVERLYEEERREGIIQ
ncbi:MAG TPA: hypothetical protein VNU24_07985 [Solirubrobacteraceae bacterium]|jgi:hypothetical protein|nr:hypothetical protein [Solirubrobacteraceae bacterium]